MKVYGQMDENLLRLAERVYGAHFQQGGLLPDVFIEHGYLGNGGLGALFKGLWNSFKPIATSGAKYLGKHLLGSAGQFLGDVASGENWKDAGKARAKEALANILSGQTGSGRAPRISDKTLHHAVKLFTFYPPSVARRRLASKLSAGYQRRRRRPSAGRKRKTAAKSPPVRRRRRKAAGAPKKAQRRRKAGGTTRKRRVTRRRRPGTQLAIKQAGEGYGRSDDWF